MARKVWGIVALGTFSLAATIAVAFAASGGNDDQPRGPRVVAGSAAPEIRLATLEGRDFRLSETRGHPVVLTFGASWCHPCREEYPRLERIRMNTPELKIVGVLENDSPGIMRDFMREVGANWPVLDDVDAKTAAAYGVDGLPVTLFIDRGGFVMRRTTGSIGEADLAKYVAEITAGRTPSTASK